MTMTRKMTMAAALAAAFAMAAPAAQAQSHGERAAVERAGMDYLDGFYEGDADKIRRSVHPDVTKVGFMSRGGSPYRSSPMSFTQMIEYADGVKASGEHPPADAPKAVHLLEMMDQTAAIRVDAWWGSDYMHLAKYDGEWKIIHVLWQTPPPQR